MAPPILRPNNPKGLLRMNVAPVRLTLTLALYLFAACGVSDPDVSGSTAAETSAQTNLIVGDWLETFYPGLCDTFSADGTLAFGRGRNGTVRYNVDDGTLTTESLDSQGNVVQTISRSLYVTRDQQLMYIGLATRLEGQSGLVGKWTLGSKTSTKTANYDCSSDGPASFEFRADGTYTKIEQTTYVGPNCPPSSGPTRYDGCFKRTDDTHFQISGAWSNSAGQPCDWSNTRDVELVENVGFTYGQVEKYTRGCP